MRRVSTTEHMKPAAKRCRDCPEGSRRKAPYPGPRCYTHHKAVLRARKAAAHERHVQRVYGLSEGDYERLYAAQGGKCAICQRATGKVKKLSVDHDHKTGKVRGLCCTACNKHILGHARDDIEFFKRAIAYLENPPANSVLE